jgi:hypothetical protein
LAVAYTDATQLLLVVEPALPPPPASWVDARCPGRAVTLVEQRAIRGGAVDGVAAAALRSAPHVVGRTTLESKLTVTPSLARATFAICTVITGVTGIILRGRTTSASASVG